MTQQAFCRIEKWFAQTRGQPAYAAFYYTTDGIFCVDSFLQSFFKICFAAYFEYACFYFNVFQQFFCHHTGCHQANGQSSAKMSTTTKIFMTAEFLVRYKIGMTGSWHRALFFIIARAGIFVFE